MKCNRGNLSIFYAKMPDLNTIRLICYNECSRKSDRVVEGAALEKQCAGNRTEGSNPSSSAIQLTMQLQSATTPSKDRC